MAGLQNYSSTIPYLQPPISPNSKRIKQEAAEYDWARRLTRASEVVNHPDDAEPLPKSYGLEKMEKLERYALEIEDVLDEFRMALAHDESKHPFNDESMKLPDLYDRVHEAWDLVKSGGE